MSLAPHKTMFKKNQGARTRTHPFPALCANRQIGIDDGRLGGRMAQNVWSLNTSLLSESRCERSTFIETEREVILAKPIPSAAANRVFTLMTGRTFWLVLELFFHILLCFGSRLCRPLLGRDPGCLAHLGVLGYLIGSALL